jgi:hypothetical protein
MYACSASSVWALVGRMNDDDVAAVVRTHLCTGKAGLLAIGRDRETIYLSI